MSPHDRFATATARIAVIPNIIRTRRADELRAQRSVLDFDARVERAVEKLEKVAADLEKALA